MKKYISLVLALGLSLSAGCSVAIAAEATSTATTTTAVSTQISEAKITAVKPFIESAFTKLGASIQKDAIVGAKVESRIVKLQAEGKDVSKAVEQIQAVRAEWDTTYANLTALPSAIEKLLKESDVKTARESIKSLLSKSQNEVLALHKSMGAVVDLLKAGLPAAATPAAQ